MRQNGNKRRTEAPERSFKIVVPKYFHTEAYITFVESSRALICLCIFIFPIKYFSESASLALRMKSQIFGTSDHSFCPKEHYLVSSCLYYSGLLKLWGFPVKLKNSVIISGESLLFDLEICDYYQKVFLLYGLFKVIRQRKGSFSFAQASLRAFS